MERQAFENNDFSGGLSDEYVPSKDNRLDACENICLDDDLTAIQRPGSAQLDQSNAAYGRHAEQLQVQGLFENTQELYSVNDNKSFHYPKSGDAFLKVDPITGTMIVDPLLPTNYINVPDTNPRLFNNILPAAGELSGGNVNGIISKEVVHVTNSNLAYPQKFFKDDSSTYYSMGVGLPRLPDMHFTYYGRFYPNPYCYVGFFKTENTTYVGTPPGYTKPTPETKLINCRTDAGSIETTYWEPLPTDDWGWSDRSYTYKDNIAVKSSWAHKYQFSLCLKITYTIGGVKYVKRSAPTTPTYFLSNVPLQSVVTTGTTPGPTPAPGYLFTKTELYQLGITYNKEYLFPILRAMNLPFFTYPLSEAESFMELEIYVTEDNGSELLLRGTKSVYDPDFADFQFASFGPPRWNANEDSVIATELVPAPSGFNPVAVTNYTLAANKTTYDYTSLFYTGVTPDIVTWNELKDPNNPTLLYTSGGVLPYDPPPPCRYIFRSGTYAFYLNIKEQYIEENKAVDLKYRTIPYRLKISNANDPDSVPEGNYVDLPDEITGGGDVLDRAIIGTIREIYRVDGRYDSTGTGLVNGQILSSETGVLSHKSMVSVKDRLFFCGDDGIYMTDGIGVLCISRHISRTYRKLIQAVATDTTGEFIQINRTLAQENISAVYDRVYDRIIFSFGTSALALELKASRLEEAHGAFYGPWFVGTDPSTAVVGFAALGTFKDMIVRGDSYGHVLQMSPGYMSDPIVNPAIYTNPDRRYPIIYRFRTAKYAFGSLVVKKWVNYVTFILKRRKVLTGGESEIDVQVNAYNDGERVRQVLKPAHYNGERDLLFDEDPKYVGVPVPKVITDTLVNFQRRFGHSGLRCLSKSVEFTNGMNVVGKSDDFEQALVSGVLVSLPNYPTFSWPQEVQDVDQKGYMIAFAVDNYQTKYSVVSSSGATMTISSAGPAGIQKWKLYSYSNKQFFGLHSLGLVYTLFGSKHSAYDSSQQGGNSGDAGE